MGDDETKNRMIIDALEARVQLTESKLARHRGWILLLLLLDAAGIGLIAFYSMRQEWTFTGTIHAQAFVAENKQAGTRAWLGADGKSTGLSIDGGDKGAGISLTLVDGKDARLVFSDEERANPIEMSVSRGRPYLGVTGQDRKEVFTINGNSVNCPSCGAAQPAADPGQPTPRPDP